MTTMGITSFASLPSKMALLREDASVAAEVKDAVPGGGRHRGRKAPPPRPTPHHHHPHQPPPLAVARRNARERNRVKQVNNGFATLRQHIPAAVAEAYAASTAAASGEAAAGAVPQGRGKKLSKVETLRLAVDYIRSLQRLLSDEAAGAGASPVPSSAGAGGGFTFADDDDDGRSGTTGASLDDDLASADGSGSPFSLAADDGRYLQQLYAAPQVQFAPPSVVVKQEPSDQEPPPGAVDRAVLEMMWWEQARRLRIISATPPPPSPS